MKFPQNFNKDLAYILGALRDGNFVRDQKQHAYRIRIYQKNKDWILHVSSILKRMFGKEVYVNQDKRTGVWSTTLSSKEIFEIISELDAIMLSLILISQSILQPDIIIEFSILHLAI